MKIEYEYEADCCHEKCSIALSEYIAEKGTELAEPGICIYKEQHDDALYFHGSKMEELRR